MSQVAEQYEAYPYPARDPADEARRLITGSPSHPLEMDHFLWGGQRDWSKPLRALVAGGGTGDALIQMASVLKAAGRPYEITYVDLSRAARAIAEERARVRKLDGIAFVTGSLLDAPEMGRFDYIDCCGVLHHLPDPQAGFDALAAALAPGGGMGLMVYAPYGRSGVYPLQDAFAALSRGMTPEARLKLARSVHARLPEGHPFRRNPHLVDHEQGDAGFYDLLLHSQDRPFSIEELLESLSRAGLAFAGAPMAALYDPSRFLPDGAEALAALDEAERMGVAEKLDGTIKTHVVYAVRQGQTSPRPGATPEAVPHLKGVAGPDLARQVERRGEVSLTRGPVRATITVDRAAAPLIARVDGRRTLAQIAAEARLDSFAFNALWRPVERALVGQGVLLYSRLLLR